MGRAGPGPEQRRKGDRPPGGHTGKPGTTQQCTHRRIPRWKGAVPGNGTHGGSPSGVKGNAHPWRGTGVPRLGCPAGKARRFVAHRCVRELQRSASERTGPGQMRASGQASDRDQAGLVSAGRVTTRRSWSAHARRGHDTGSWPAPGFGSGRIGVGPAHGGAGQDTRQVTTATPAGLDFRATGATDEG